MVLRIMVENKHFIKLTLCIKELACVLRIMAPLNYYCK